MSACVKCGSPLQAQGAGRPSRYCSTRCRRAAEFEIRRVQRRLEALEGVEQQQRRRLDLRGWASAAQEKTWRSELAWTQAEVVRVEERLRSLLDAGAREQHKETA